jgi:hypothetical protein
MKLTIEIPNEHAHALLSLLANLTATPTELVADPCPGHPELPLAPVLASDDRTAKWIAAGGDVPPTPEQLAALAGRTRTDDEDPALADVRWQATPEATPEPGPWDAWDAAEAAKDQTQRVLQWPDHLTAIALPELPEGKTEWVYRGTFGGQKYDADDRAIFYYCTTRKDWIRTYDFSTVLHHIEAI